MAGHGKGGRPRLPLSVKQLKGTANVTKERAAAMVAMAATVARRTTPGKVGEPPKGSSAAFRLLWDDLANAVEEAGTYSRTYRAAFREMVEAGVLKAEAYKKAMADGRSGIWSPAAARFGSYLTAFGLTPSTIDRAIFAMPQPAEAATPEGSLSPLPPLAVVK